MGQAVAGCEGQPNPGGHADGTSSGAPPGLTLVVGEPRPLTEPACCPPALLPSQGVWCLRLVATSLRNCSHRLVPVHFGPESQDRRLTRALVCGGEGQHQGRRVCGESGWPFRWCRGPPCGRHQAGLAQPRGAAVAAEPLASGSGGWPEVPGGFRVTYLLGPFYMLVTP